MTSHINTSPAAAAPAASARQRLGQRLGAMPVLMAGTFMVVLDFFIVNVALPLLQRDLHAGSNSVEWVVAGFGVALAVSLITAGRMGDAFGRRRMLCIGLVLFTLASAACGTADNATVLVVARIIQGGGAAFISTTALSIIGVLYQGQARIRALTIYGVVLGMGALSGQLIGGALIALDPFGLTWRSCFLINLPIGAVALALARVTIPETRSDERGSLDPLGTALLSAMLVTLVLPLVDGRQQGWPLWSWLCLAASPLALIALIVQQRMRVQRGQSPLLSRELVRERSFVGGLSLQLIYWAGQASFFLVLGLYLQEGRGLSPLQAGGIFTIMAVSYMAASMQAPMLMQRHGRGVIRAGALALAAGHALLFAAVASGDAASSVFSLAPGLLLAGVGMGLCIAPLTTLSLSQLDPQHAGMASGALSTVQQMGNSIGVAVTGAIFFGSAHSGISHAFELSVAELAGLLVVVAAFCLVLPRRLPEQLVAAGRDDGAESLPEQQRGVAELPVAA